jgi:hypothetical protein
MPDHDSLYHRLFSHPGLVAQLLREFITDPWVGDLELDAMERVNTKFHSRGNRRRDSDVIWRIRLKRGGDAYLLLLLEFQSTPDRWMALRVMAYASLLWQHLVREKRLTQDGRLPPVFPVVIYNGNSRWTMPVNLAPLIGLPGGSPLWRWQPEMRYHVLDEGAFTEDDLAGRDTLAALLFRLENARQPDQTVALVDAVIDWFRRHAGFEALMPLFAMLAGRVVEIAEGAAPGVLVSENLLEVRTMLATRAAEWKQQWRREGEAALLTLMLERRFGALPDAVRDQIAAADPPTIEQWAARLFDAASIDDVVH